MAATAFYDSAGYLLLEQDGLMVDEECCCDCPCLACDGACTGSAPKKAVLTPSLLMERDAIGDPCDACAQINDSEWELPYVGSQLEEFSSLPTFHYREHRCFWELVLDEDAGLGACQVRSVRLQVKWCENLVNTFCTPVGHMLLTFYPNPDFTGSPIIHYTLQIGGGEGSTEKLACDDVGNTLTQSVPGSAPCVSTAHPGTTAICSVAFIAP